ncbi:N-acetyltransferase [Nocardioides marmoriginsengisoli]|uniref:N-acetyltransferase n=1 Tax=Nocardioides marmoriginsengisoli TaxID=661483 RepID=A0A3N0CEW4_9ACTN|nr:GNAT family N-acetyltransferase [Nocardioides marmoriginsengisoli]RNL61985.1 N-acetyltransferase [Nocardioides marmoriginsengisoli]
MSDIEVSNNTELSRYEAHIDGQLAGFAEYHLRGSSIVFTHTEVGEAFGGQGVAGAIVRSSLDEIRAAGESDVVPICPFYKGWIEKHPDYADLVHHAEGR